MKNIITTLLLLAVSAPLFAQINLKIEVMPDNETYLISFLSDVTYTYPGYVMASGQITIRVPHGVGPNSFEVSDLTMETPGAEWQDNSRINAPVEAPSWDYISFGLISFGTNVYQFTEGVEIPVFSFKNGAPACADSVEIVDNETDPFYPPNSVGANIGNTVVILGAGLNNAYSGTFGSAKVPCLPETACTNLMNEDVYLCDGQTYMGMSFSQDTVLEYHYTSSAGCDSAFFTNIIVDGDINTTIDTAICEGETFKGVEITQDEEIAETYMLPNGCDSTVTYNVQVITGTSSNNDVTVLPGQEVNGIAVYSDTTIVATLTGSNGCDSISTTNVTVYTVPVSANSVELCGSELYNGMSFSQDTTWIDTLTAPNGFDSLVINNIYVYPAYDITNYVSLCEGDVYNGQAYTQDATFTNSYLTTQACDSIVTTIITVTNPQYISVDTSICQGETFLGELYDFDTVFTTTLLSVNGCDSMIYSTNLEVRPSVYPLITGDLDLCLGETSTLSAYGGTDFAWNTGSTDDQIVVTDAGTFSVTITNAYNCTDETSVTVSLSSLDASVEVTSPRCDGELNGTILFNGANNGVPPYSYSIDGGNFFTTHNEFPFLSPGLYDVRVKDKNGCLWTDSAEIEDPMDIFVELGGNHTIRLGESVELSANTNMVNIDSIQWTPADGLECTSCTSTLASPLETTTYHIILTDENGCVIEDKVQVTVDANRQVYVPTAFSPNSDGHNDRLTVYADENIVLIRRFVVFERWGGQVFEAENFPANEPGEGWDGQWKGSVVPTGVYIWLAEVEYIDGDVELYEGSVMVIK